MELIVVSQFWTGVQAVFLNANEESAGMPAFDNVFRALVGHERVDAVNVFFFTNLRRVRPSLPENMAKKVHVVFYSYRNKFELMLMLLKAFVDIVIFIAHKRKTQDLVLFGQGYVGALAGLISLVTGIKNIRRIYGTFLVDCIHKSKLMMFLSHPLDYLNFRLPAKAIIVTNDGTHGDSVFRKINSNKRLDTLMFLVNGAMDNRALHQAVRSIDELKQIKVISYIARVDRWKQQLVAVKAFLNSDLPRQGYILKIAGPIIDQSYRKEIESEIMQSGYPAAVELLGPLKQQQAFGLLKQSLITLSFYETSNFGNVFIEALVCGVPLLSRNINGSLNYVPDDCYLNVASYDLKELTVAMESAALDLERLLRVSVRAIEVSNERIPTWSARVNQELRVILDE